MDAKIAMIKDALSKFPMFGKLRKTLYDIRYNAFWKNDRIRTNLSGSKEFDRIPYIIRREDYSVGLFSYFNTILNGLDYADRNNFIPVVDMKNYRNAYIYDNEVGRINSWEYYFEQPGGISLEDALSCRKYILGRDAALHSLPKSYDKEAGLNRNRELCRKYIRFKPAVLEKLAQLQNKASGKQKVLGVLIRGTDYITLKRKGAPIQPTTEQAIAKVQEIIQEKGFDAVYLATEDKNIAAKFQAAFGDKLILPECDYLDYDYSQRKTLFHVNSSRPNDRYLRGLEYLVSMLFRSKCKGFLSSLCNGYYGVMYLSDGFEYLHAFDLGVYQ